MNTKLIKLAAIVTWSGALLSSAAPADARILTSQEGEYAVCTNRAEATNAYTTCFVTYSYLQYTKLVSTACSTGACADTAAYVRSEFKYTSGRKDTYSHSICSYVNVYSLGSCAC
jgi:hypothetical protein